MRSVLDFSSFDEKYRVIVSIAYEQPGTEPKDLEEFVEKLKR